MKWEYKTTYIIENKKMDKTLELIEAELKIRGLEGWELVNFIGRSWEGHFVFIFKKPLD